MKQLNICLLLVFFATNLFAQVGVGQWQDYMSYTSAQKVIEANGKIFCITTGGLFSYDTQDNSLQKFNQINGLSDVDPGAIAYGKDNDVVVLAYGNSNVDLIYPNEIFNISDIKRKQIQGDKNIYHVLVVGSTAYLSCGFGIVAINLEKREIKDTYYIGENGNPVVVLDMAFDGTSLYAGTSEGIYKADISATNLQDFHNWEKIENIPNADGRFDQLEAFNGKIFVSYTYQEGGQDKSRLYEEINGEWKLYDSNNTFIKGLQVCNNLLIISRGYEVVAYSTDDEEVDKINSYSFETYQDYYFNVQEAFQDANGTYWLADVNNGLVKVDNGSDEKICPVGPPNNKLFTLVANANDLWVAAGGRNDAWGNIYNWAQAERYRDGSWQEFSYRNYTGLVGVHDLVNIVVDPQDPDHVFAGTWGEGVFELQGDQLVNHFTDANSSLLSFPAADSSTIVRIGGMAFDSKNNLWVTNSIVGEPLSEMKTDGTWESFVLTGISSSKDVGDIVITDNDDQWIVIPRTGGELFVRKADGTAGRQLKVTAYFTNGKEEQYTKMDNIRSIAIDKQGAIWVGTTIGIAVYFNPGDIWNNSTFYASQPGLDLNDGIYHPLLQKETVTAIAVDGANRKWIGTQNSGVFLISADGTKELEDFNTSNSPLLSNSVSSIAINDNTGEVFFGTSDGIISYRGQATKGGDDYSGVYAFPNPVREDYHGDIVITGLVTDTDVKITDISGNLVFKTTSLGGQAIWDGKNLNGKRVSTGVYMVFGNDKFGEKTFTTKILFIH